MKPLLLFLLLLAKAVLVHGQGTLIFDQQSATDGIATFFNSINQDQPLGQAFTPSLSAVGFVQLQLLNGLNPTNTTIAVNLWEGSIGGTLLGCTLPLELPAGYALRTTTFFFNAPINLTPGTVYYLQPVIVSGGNNNWYILTDFYNYSGGNLFLQGEPRTDGLNAWFREGIIVPEPSASVLLGLGCAFLFYSRRFITKNRSRL